MSAIAKVYSITRQGLRLHLAPPIEHDERDRWEVWETSYADYPLTGTPGILQRTDICKELGDDAISEGLLYYDDNGVLAGTFNYFPNDIRENGERVEWAGAFTVVVRPDARRRGIGKKLLEEACRRWPINFERQLFTPDGLHLVFSYLGVK